jgi:hypothetical protein
MYGTVTGIRDQRPLKQRLAHFACRSHREEGKPFDTVFELGDGDGDRLVLLHIVRCRVATTELAVL